MTCMHVCTHASNASTSPRGRPDGCSFWITSPDDKQQNLYCGCHVLAGIVVLVAFLSVYPIQKLRFRFFMIATFLPRCLVLVAFFSQFTIIPNSEVLRMHCAAEILPGLCFLI
jgi:hypothetical protein